MPVRPTEKKPDPDERKGQEAQSKAKPEQPKETSGFTVLTAPSDNKNANSEKNDFLQFRPVFKSLKDLSAVRPGVAPFRAPLRVQETKASKAENDGELKPAERTKEKKRSKSKPTGRPMSNKQRLLQSKRAAASPVDLVVSCSNSQCKQKFQHRSQMINHVKFECWHTKLNCLRCENGFRRMHFIAHQRICRIASMEDLSTTSELNSERTADAPDLCSRDELGPKRNLRTKLLDLTLNQMLAKRKSNDSLVDESTSETFSDKKPSEPKPKVQKRIETVKRTTKVSADVARAKLGTKATKAKSKPPGDDAPVPIVKSTVSRESETDLTQSRSVKPSTGPPSNSIENKSTISNYRINDEPKVLNETEPKLVKKDAPKLNVAKKSSTKFTKGCNVS